MKVGDLILQFQRADDKLVNTGIVTKTKEKPKTDYSTKDIFVWVFWSDQECENSYHESNLRWFSKTNGKSDTYFEIVESI